jgi:ribonuclease P protein component
MSDEAHFSAEQSRARPAARLSQPDVNRGGPCGDSRASQPRPQEALRLISISQRRDFLAANSAKRAPGPGFVLLVRDRQDGDAQMRLGITVTKKIGNAVIRNRMKRRFRALARDVLPHMGINGADHVMIGRAGGVERDFAALRAELVKALKRVAG